MSHVLINFPFMSYRWVLTHHTRNIITGQTLEYYDIHTNHKEHLSKNELELEADYEDKLVAEFRRNHLFEGRSPDKLTTYLTNDVASKEIEQSLLNIFELGDQGVRNFMVT